MQLLRRSMLLGASAMIAGSARADDRVFLNYTQSELDRAYDQAAWAPARAAAIGRYASDSAAVRQAVPPHTQRYGSSDVEMLDIFAPPNPGRAPIHVFLHGGAWASLGKEDAAAAAPTFLDSGAIYVAVGFANIPAARLPDMVEQCRRALRFVHSNAAAIGGNADAIHISGHSSGAHLAAVLLATDWTASGKPADMIKSALLMSGIYDLAPVMMSSRRTYVKLSADEVQALSPLRHLDRWRCPVSVAVGDEESPEFKRQSQVLADALAGMGLLRNRNILFNHSHFEVPEQLKRADSLLSRQALAMMGLV